MVENSVLNSYLDSQMEQYNTIVKYITKAYQDIEIRRDLLRQRSEDGTLSNEVLLELFAKLEERFADASLATFQMVQQEEQSIKDMTAVDPMEDAGYARNEGMFAAKLGKEVLVYLPFYWTTKGIVFADSIDKTEGAELEKPVVKHIKDVIRNADGYDKCRWQSFIRSTIHFQPVFHGDAQSVFKMRGVIYSTVEIRNAITSNIKAFRDDSDKVAFLDMPPTTNESVPAGTYVLLVPGFGKARPTSDILAKWTEN